MEQVKFLPANENVMTESEFKELQYNIRVIKSSPTRQIIMHKNGCVTREQILKSVDRYKEAKAIRREIVFFRTKVKEWGRTCDTVGVLKKDWANGVLLEYLGKLKEANLIFKEF